MSKNNRVKIPTIIEEKPANFLTKQVRIKVNNNIAYFSPVGEDLSFEQITKLRVKKDPKIIAKRLMSKEGHVFANLGVSVIIEIIEDITPKPKAYNLFVKQVRDVAGSNKEVIKLLSGYIDLRNISALENALEEEIAEEFLCFTKENTVIPFEIDYGNDDVKELKEVYSRTLRYDSKNKIRLRIVSPKQILSYNRFFNFDYLQAVLDIGSGKQLKGKPTIYFHSDTNSAQLVYGIVLKLNSSLNNSIIDKIYHAEDNFNKEKNVLEVIAHPSGALLVDQKGNRYIFDKELSQVDENSLVYSEAFVGKDRIIEPNVIF